MVDPFIRLIGRLNRLMEENKGGIRSILWQVKIWPVYLTSTGVRRLIFVTLQTISRSSDTDKPNSDIT